MPDAPFQHDQYVYTLLGQPDKAREAMEKVRNCKRNCAFIVTERHDMVRRPWVPIKWILKNKWRIRKGQDICWD